MSTGPIDELRASNPVPKSALPEAPPGMAQRIMSKRRAGRGAVSAGWPGWAVALATGLLVVAVGGSWMFLLGPSEEQGADTAPFTTGSSPDSTQPGSTQPGESTSTALESTTTLAVFEAAPWSAAPLGAADVPAVLASEWAAADNRGWCSALFPADPDSLASGATVRARYAGGGWGIAWDLPSGPGRYSDGGEYCPDCGGEAFGIIGVGFAADPADIEIWPEQVDWSDGSVAGYGYEGVTATDEGETPPHLAYVHVSGQGCNYNVWSFLGEDHLLTLMSRLRLVEGMQAPPVVPVGQQGIVAQPMGDPSWAGPALTPGDVPAALLNAWRSANSAGGSCPLLAFDDLGAAAGAVLRSRNGADDLMWAVSWDLAEGPGRNASGTGNSEYCADCGWSVVGLQASLLPSQDNSLARLPVTHTWSDGSRAWVMSEGTMLSGGIPDELMSYVDADSGQPLVSHPYRAVLEVPGSECGYDLWSFLGEEHVEYLLQHLRWVEVST